MVVCYGYFVSYELLLIVGMVLLWLGLGLFVLVGVGVIIVCVCCCDIFDVVFSVEEC